MTETTAAPAGAFPFSDDHYEDPIEDDGVGMVIAYANLPKLNQARTVILNNAAHYGPDVHQKVTKGLDQYREVRGARFYNSHPGVPHYSGNFEDDARTTLPPAPDARPFVAVPHLTIGGIIWPLPDGKWQYIDIMADGRVEPSAEM